MLVSSMASPTPPSRDAMLWLLGVLLEEDARGVPATEDDLDALERAWGTPLPPSYRMALESDDGTLTLNYSFYRNRILTK